MKAEHGQVDAAAVFGTRKGDTMRLEMERDHLVILPENYSDVAYIEHVLKLTDGHKRAVAYRRSSPTGDMFGWEFAPVEIRPIDQHEERTP